MSFFVLKKGILTVRFGVPLLFASIRGFGG